MAHNIETMAWTGDKPWHGLGVEVKLDITPIEIQKAAQLDWTASKTPAYTLSEPDWTEQVGVMPARGRYFIAGTSGT